MTKTRPPLDRWLWIQGLYKTRFAERIGITLEQLRPALQGKTPSAKTAHAIVKGTGGEIDYNALFAPSGDHEPAVLAKLLKSHQSEHGENHDE